MKPSEGVTGASQTIGQTVPTSISSSRPLTLPLAREHKHFGSVAGRQHGRYVKASTKKDADIHATYRNLKSLPASFHTPERNHWLQLISSRDCLGREHPVWLPTVHLLVPEKVSTAAYYMFDVAQLRFKIASRMAKTVFLGRQFQRGLGLSALALLRSNQTPWDEPVSLDEAINIAREFMLVKALLLHMQPPRQPFPSQTPPSSAITSAPTTTITYSQETARSTTEMRSAKKRGLCYNCGRNMR
nr:uncharacterized protein LOC109172063 [Ipomoea batatas]